MDKVPPPVKGVVIRETKVPEKHQQNIMLRNVGMTDRILRGVIGLYLMRYIIYYLIEHSFQQQLSLEKSLLA